MAKLDGEYWLDFELPSDRAAVPNQAFQILLNPGSGAVTLTFFGSLSETAVTPHNNPDGTTSDKPTAPQIDMTLALTGLAAIAPVASDRFLLVDNAGRLAGLVKFWAKIVLASGMNDGDFIVEGPVRVYEAFDNITNPSKPWEHGKFWLQ